MQNNRSFDAGEIGLLVIDDDLIQRKIIAKLGRQAGFTVTDVETFEEAERILNERKFDCITLDLSLGEKNGASLLPAIVASSAGTPVIVISGADERIIRSTVAVAQALSLDTELVSKPLNLEGLRYLLLNKYDGALTARRSLVA